jgi:hypothetical protein
VILLSPSESPFVEHSTHPKSLCSFFTFGYHLILYTVYFALRLFFMFMFEFSKAYLKIQKRIILIIKGSLINCLWNRHTKSLLNPLRSLASVNVEGVENRLRKFKIATHRSSSASTVESLSFFDCTLAEVSSKTDPFSFGRKTKR